MYFDSKPLPELSVSQWFNTPDSITLKSLLGRVVVLHTFQMLCPGCVAKGIPQAQKVHDLFSPKDVVVLGLHTVFEHHDVMGPDALQVFLREYGLTFPIGIDRPSNTGPIPTTMQNFGLRGTPSLVIFDRFGRIRLNHFGHIDDLQLGALVGTLIAEETSSEIKSDAMNLDRRIPGYEPAGNCEEDQCCISQPGVST